MPAKRPAKKAAAKPPSDDVEVPGEVGILDSALGRSLVRREQPPVADAPEEG